MATESDSVVRQLVMGELRSYVDRRVAKHAEITIDTLLKKDIVMFALHGITTVEDFIAAAFNAWDSSSGETMMGDTWALIARKLASGGAIEMGDLVVERNNVLWVVDLKTQANTFNRDSKVQALRELKRKVDALSKLHRPGRQPVRGAIAIVRADSRDRIVTIKANHYSEPNTDINGFTYRDIRGSAFWIWLTGSSNVTHLIDDVKFLGIDVRQSRERTLMRLAEELSQKLAGKGLSHDIDGILELAVESE